MAVTSDELLDGLFGRDLAAGSSLALVAPRSAASTSMRPQRWRYSA